MLKCHVGENATNTRVCMYKATVPKSSDVADPDPKELDENTGKGASQKLKMFF